jgi:small-conductance mechanosensitive channel
MKKAIYILTVTFLSFWLINYGMTLEQEPALVNGIYALEFVIPGFAIFVTNVFTLMFEKENRPWIVFMISMAVCLIGELIALSYYRYNDYFLTLTLKLLALALIVSMINITLLRCLRWWIKGFPKSSQSIPKNNV